MASHRMTRTWLVGLALAGLLLGAAGVGALVTRDRFLPTLHKTDPALHDQIIDADIRLINSEQAAISEIRRATAVTPSDPMIAAVASLQAGSTTLHQWVLLFINQSVTKVTQKTPTIDIIDFSAEPPVIVTVPVPGPSPSSNENAPSPASFKITQQQAQDLLTALQECHNQYQTSIDRLTKSVDTVQKTAAFPDYEAAMKSLELAIPAAAAMLKWTKGKIADQTIWNALSNTIESAEALLETSTGMTVEDHHSAHEFQTTIEALNTSAASLVHASDQALDSNATWQMDNANNPRITTASDPMPPACASRGVGTNGCLKHSSLCVVQRDQLLRCDAVEPFKKLSEAYKEKFGHGLYVDNAYRNYDSQVAMHQKYGSPRAAIPGTSNHGWGLALDLPEWETPSQYPPGYAAEMQYNTPQHKWLTKNAPKYGWVINVPGEPWHMNYVGKKR